MNFIKGFFIGFYLVAMYFNYETNRLAYLVMLSLSPMIYIMLELGLNKCRKLLK